MVVLSLSNTNGPNASITTGDNQKLKNKNKLNQKGKSDKSNQWIWKEFFVHKDNNHNNVLMTLAKHERDEVLEEMLTNDVTKQFITHDILSRTNKVGQTLMGMIEVHGENMPNSMQILVKLEYACHGHDVTKAQICLSEQIETSVSSSEVIKALKRLEPMICGVVL